MILFESETTSNVLLTCQFPGLFHVFNRHLIFYFISTVTSVKAETPTVIQSQIEATKKASLVKVFD